MHTNALPRPRGHLFKIAAVLLLAVGLALALITATTSPARADSGAGQRIAGCDDSSYWVKDIQVTNYSDGTFKISLRPSWTVRVDGTGPMRTYVTNDMWHQIQGCVTGLYGTLADSIWQQLDCHRVFGANFVGTGDTYDLESWHLPLADPSTYNYFQSRCLNNDYGARVAPDDPWANVA